MSKISNLPIVKNIWSYIREQKILKKHKEVSVFWQPIIEQYFNNQLPRYELKKKKELDGEKIIWQYWAQGFESNLPEVVQCCFDSIDKYKKDWRVIRLSDDTIEEYLEFPDFVNQKIKNNTFSKTFFSDLLRVALLKMYGGVWLDATILMTGNFPSYLTSSDYFVYQRDFDEKYKSFWKNSYAFYWNWDKDFKVNILSSIFFSKRNGQMVSALLDLMLNYWNNQDELLDYFVFQILMDDLMKGNFVDNKCQLVSDVYPHILQTKFNGSYPYMGIDDVLKVSCLHKMSYFDELGLKNFKTFIAR